MNKQTSRAYIVSNILLRNNIYANWKEFYNIINRGPEEIKKYLSNMWNSISEKDVVTDCEIVDLETKIDENNFKVTANNINGVQVYYFIFPDSNFVQAQAKCVALALTPNMPRYFTMEIASHFNTKEPYYVIGEWKLVQGKFIHKNYGKITNETIENFSYHISELMKNN